MSEKVALLETWRGFWTWFAMLLFVILSEDLAKKGQLPQPATPFPMTLTVDKSKNTKD